MLPGGLVLSVDDVTEATMAANDPMTIDERRKYLYRMQQRFRDATRRERAKLPDEMAAVTSMHRKSLTRLILGNL
jgi:hypothetical protein